MNVSYLIKAHAAVCILFTGVYRMIYIIYPVSYTHLDVYKRQVFLGMIVIGQKTVGLGNLGLEIAGLAGLLAELYVYNRKYK